MDRKVKKRTLDRNHDRGNMAQMVGHTFNRRSIAYYGTLKKPALLRSMAGFIASYDKMKFKLIEIELENNFLHRKLGIVEDELAHYKEIVGKRTFSGGHPRRKKKE